ncbi:hypothetical protein Q0M94_19165 (plasmid) [Deinococcus radiomollis]|uniref:hypothetical protein n=1 Tax=Deinococcus radiomollis TaxID=468916 RepID=UPI003891E81E
MAQANVIGTMRDINGLSIKNATIIFNLLEAGAAAEGLVVPSIPITTYTDDVGFFSVAVFANGLDKDFPRYRVELVEGSKILDTYYIQVPAIRTEYSLSELVQFEQSNRETTPISGLDNYYTKNDTIANFYTKNDAEARFYSKTAIDTTFAQYYNKTEVDTQVTSVTNRVAANESSISSQTTRLNTDETNIATNTNSINALTPRVTSLETNTYSKSYVDTKFSSYYTKTQVDSGFTNYYTAAQVDSGFANYYTKNQIDTTFSGYYTKANIDTTFTQYYNKGAIDGIIANIYSKSDSDGRYYTKAVIDSTFTGYYTKPQIDSDFTSYYTKAQVDSKELLKADKTYLLSRGMNLITNGFASIGDLTNFSQFTLYPTDTAAGGASFLATGYAGNLQLDEHISVDPTKYYRWTFTAKSINYVPLASYFFAFSRSYDIDELPIDPWHYTYRPESYTTLTQPLKPGDTVIHLTSVSGWAGKAYPWIKIHQYKNGKGFTWGPKTYSRNTLINYAGDTRTFQDAGVDTTANTITIFKGWDVPNPDAADGSWPVGTPISLCFPAGSYQYFAVSNTQLPNAWTKFDGTIGGLDTSGNSLQYQFPTGTASIRLGFLVNGNNGNTQDGVHYGNTTAISGLAFSEVNIQNLTGGLPGVTSAVVTSGGTLHFTNGILTSVS